MGVVVESRTDANSTSRLARWFSLGTPPACPSGSTAAPPGGALRAIDSTAGRSRPSPTTILWVLRRLLSRRGRSSARPAQESLFPGGTGGMDVRFVSDDGIEQHPVGELEQLLARDHGLVWVDIPVCDQEAARVLREVFGFHPLAVQACIERNAVPKVRAYRDHLFVILHAPELGTGGHVHYVELDQFIGPRYVVTVHGPVNPAVPPEAAQRETHAVLGRIEAGRLRPRSAFELSYAIVSAMAQAQEAFVETVTREVWPLEQRVTSGHIGDSEQFLEELFGTRHALLAVSNMAALGHQIYQRMAALARVIPPDCQPLVADLKDQFDRVAGVADGQIRYLEGVIEFYKAWTDTKVTIFT